MIVHTVHKVLALFWRDLAVARSYRTLFVMEAAEALLSVASCYYLSQFVQSEELSRALPAGKDYFAFALVGLAFFDYLSVSVITFERSLREERQNGTLEALLATQTSLPTILAGSAIYPFVLMALRTLIYLAWAVLVFDFPVAAANWLGLLLVLACSVLAFAGLGVISASYSLVFKGTNPTKWVVIGLSGLLGGTLYPVSVLPEPLQAVARLIPVSYSLEAMRAALLEGASSGLLWPAIRALLLFAVVLLPLSLAVFAWSLRRTKIIGTLTHF